MRDETDDDGDADKTFAIHCYTRTMPPIKCGFQRLKPFLKARVSHFALIAFAFIGVVDGFTAVSTRNHPFFPSLSTRRSRSVSGAANSSESSQQELRVVIVGGGVGGLATAARLASASRKNKVGPPCAVTLLEKNQHLGGRSGSFDVTLPNLGTFRHERGPSLLLLPHVYRELFEDCSAKPEDFGLVMEQCIPAYQVVFDDGDRLDVGFPSKISTDSAADKEMLAQKLHESRRKMDKIEAAGASKWDDYMRTTSAFLDCGLPNFIEERLDIWHFPAFIIEALRDFGKAWPLKPHSDVLDAMFESEKMRALASFQDLYVGLEPYKNNDQLFGGVTQSTAPAVFGLLAAIELHPENKKAGVFAPMGGFRAVSGSFEKLAKTHGVDIQTGKMATRIESDGVYVCTVDSESNQISKDDEKPTFFPADLIIVNADLPYATNSLLPSSVSEIPIDTQQTSPFEKPRFDWDDSFLYSSGVVAFHWSIDKELKDLNTHNVFLAAAKGRSQAEESWRILRQQSAKKREDQKSVEPFNFYVHCPTKTDPTAAPKDCDSIMVLVPCPTLERKKEYASLSREEALQQYKEQFDDAYISQLRQAVLNRFAAIDTLRDLQNHIVDEVVDTPGTYADQYHVGAGTPFALSHGFGQLSLTRPGAGYRKGRDSNSNNLLYCGASSRPGNGVPLVLIGSKLVAKKALSFLTDLSAAEKQRIIDKQ